MSAAEAHNLSRIARPAVAAGVLFFDGEGRVLVVEPHYKDGWDIPGGYVAPSESPRNAAIREVGEELGISVTPGALLAIDWAPCDEGDKLLFVFDGGAVDPTRIPPIPSDHAELRSFAFCDVGELRSRMPPRLVSRITAAIDNRADASKTYVEHGALPSGARSAIWDRDLARPPAASTLIGHEIIDGPAASPAV